MFISKLMHHRAADAMMNLVHQVSERPLRRGGQLSRALVLNNELNALPPVARLLVELGTLVTRATSVAEAVASLRCQEFDAVVVDLRPDLLGYTAIDALRATQIRVPLLFISARSTVAAHQQALSLGADAVTVLPPDGQTMRAVLEGLMSRGWRRESGTAR
jgi:DNA-binding response OmpR family regulator